MKRIGAAIGSVSGIITSWYTLTQLHVIPSLYIGSLNITVILMCILAACITLLFAIWWVFWLLLSVIGAVFHKKYSPFDALLAMICAVVVLPREIYRRKAGWYAKPEKKMEEAAP